MMLSSKNTTQVVTMDNDSMIIRDCTKFRHEKNKCVHGITKNIDFITINEQRNQIFEFNWQSVEDE